MNWGNKISSYFIVILILYDNPMSFSFLIKNRLIFPRREMSFGYWERSKLIRVVLGAETQTPQALRGVHTRSRRDEENNRLPAGDKVFGVNLF